MDKWLNHPTSFKIIAVVLALLIWAIVHIDPESSPQSVTSNTDTKVIEAVPIVTVGLDTEKYALTAIEPTVARLVVEGRISSLLAANSDDYVVKVDLSNAKPEIQQLPLTVELPDGIKEVELSPKIVTVQIEELETQTHEVQIITEGQPAEGYIIGSSQIIGDTGNVVEITMPKDDYARLGVVAVKVDVTGATSTVTNKKAKIIAYDTQGNPLDHVRVTPETLVAETKITLPPKEVPIQLRYTGTLLEGYSLVSINTKVEKVTVHAQQKALDQLSLYDGFILNLGEVKASGQVMVKAEKVEGIAEVNPAEIPVDVVIEPSEQRTMTNIPITLQGLPDSLKATINESTTGRVDVNVKGASSLLERLRSSDIKLSLDVTNLEPGTHELTIAAELPAYLQVAETVEAPLTVTVEISSVDSVDSQGLDPLIPTPNTGAGLPSPSPSPSNTNEENEELDSEIIQEQQ